jgi:hypothetical protein
MWLVMYALNVQLDEPDDTLLIGRGKRVFLTIHAHSRRALGLFDVR